ncbi:hypothetical protein ACHAW6_014411 [Cyclotella cf. meneghiniana]
MFRTDLLGPSLAPKSLAVDRRRHRMLEGGRGEAEAHEGCRKKEHCGGDDDPDGLVSYRQLMREIRTRVQWRFILCSTVAGLGVKYIAYAKPRVIGRMIDEVTKHNDGNGNGDDNDNASSMSTAFWTHFRPLLLYVVLDYLLLSAQEYYKYGALHRFHKDVKCRMIANVLEQDEDYLQSERHAAGFTHLMNVECNRMQKIVNESIARFLFGILATLAGLTSLLQVDPRLAALGLVFKSPLSTALQTLSRNDIVKYAKLYDASQGAAHRVALSVLSHPVVRLLQSHGAQRRAVAWYERKQDDFLRYLQYTHLRQTLLCLVPHALDNCEDVLLLAAGIACVSEGKITLGTYFTFRSHLSLLDRGLKDLAGLWNDVLTIRMSCAVYFELLYRKAEIRSGGDAAAMLPDDCIRTLSLNDVSFAYRRNPSVKVLNGIHLRLEPGKVVALCGQSGGGKSTITRLIQRFYDPTEGSILINNVDIRTIDLAWLRKQIRVIDQDPVLPDLTIHENIALGLGDEDVDKGTEYVRERVVEAAKLADAHNFITDKCEQGYDTPVRFISRLSGGERQRIAIARALVSRAPIVICDEITASLDAETEKTVIGTLSRATEGKAVLLIAHRLSTIRHADEIVFLERGKIVERGTHDELVLLNGRYSSYLKTLNSSAKRFE